jgi:hypothetical protein
MPNESVSESLHFDRGVIYKHEDTPEGFLRLHMTIAKVGELKYFNKDGSERIEVVTPEVLFDTKSIDSFKMKPITSPHHPPVMLNADNAGAYSKGMTGNLVTIDGDFLGIVATVTDAETIRNIKNGRTKQVSCGYMAGTRQRSDGKLNQEYRWGNHVTICPEGRAGADVRVNVDSVEGEQLEVFVSEPIRNDSVDMTTNTVNSTPTLETVTLKLDEFESINIPLAYAKPISDKFKRDADSVAFAKAKIATLESELVKAKADLAEMTKDKTDSTARVDGFVAALKATGFDSVESLAAEVTTQKARGDVLEAENKSLKTELEGKTDSVVDVMALVQARRELETKCDGLLPANFDVLKATDRQLKEAAVKGKLPDLTLDGEPDASVDIYFNAVTKLHEKRDTTQPLASAARQSASTPPKTEQRADTAAWLEMVQAMTNPSSVAKAS